MAAETDTASGQPTSGAAAMLSAHGHTAGVRPVTRTAIQPTAATVTASADLADGADAPGPADRDRTAAARAARDELRRLLRPDR